MNKPANIRFTRYEKIANALSNWQIDETGYRLLEKTEWVVTEKIKNENFIYKQFFLHAISSLIHKSHDSVI
ncbi:MAG TPA: hypothetical protein ENG03_06345 [Thioploca sp.]|nr:MAG: hypothetical protein B6247_07915 [Beggiatoa sp. 4572_84]RKZ58851.1 MAG: hypothetical protein DRR08_15370 [Gammaproteobacteria bacterium]HDN26705.1 hypothetical protein [Thioploca sp.]